MINRNIGIRPACKNLFASQTDSFNFAPEIKKWTNLAACNHFKNAKTAPLSTAFTPLPPKHCSRTLKETVTINQRIDF